MGACAASGPHQIEIAPGFCHIVLLGRRGGWRRWPQEFGSNSANIGWMVWPPVTVKHGLSQPLMSWPVPVHPVSHHQLRYRCPPSCFSERNAISFRFGTELLMRHNLLCRQTAGPLQCRAAPRPASLLPWFDGQIRWASCSLCAGTLGALERYAWRTRG